MARIAPWLLLLVGCEGWPLYAHLPSEQPDAVEPSNAVYDVEGNGLQSLPVQTPPARVTVLGTAAACGWDADASAPWPEGPVDLDGDGTADGIAARLDGWYDGDVASFTLAADAPARLALSLTWDGAPDGANAPYRPDEPTGAWSQESDLDVVVRALDGDAPGAILLDAGVGRAVPEVTPPWPLDAFEAVVVQVACHHARGADWTLLARLDPL